MKKLAKTLIGLMVLSSSAFGAKQPMSYFTTKGKHFNLKKYEKVKKLYRAKKQNFKLLENMNYFTQPIVPFNTFVIDTPYDIVMAVSEKKWAMYELLKVPVGDELISLVLISDYAGKQYVGGSVDSEKNKVIKDLARFLGYSYYDASFEDRGGKVFFKTPDGEDKSFKYNLDENFNPLTTTKRSMFSSKRSSHSMNHNQENMTYVIDIYKSLNVTKFGKIKFPERDFKFQKILGLVPVRLPIAQAVIAFSKAEKSLDEWTNENNNILLDEENEVYQRVNKTNDGKMINSITHSFKRIEGKSYLKEIRHKVAGKDFDVAKVEFTPALPDLRFDFEGEHKSFVGVFIDGLDGVDAKKNQLLMIGEVVIKKDENGLIKLKLEPGDPTIKKSCRYVPAWWQGRDVETIISSEKIKFKAGVNPK